MFRSSVTLHLWDDDGDVFAPLHRWSLSMVVHVMLNYLGASATETRVVAGAITPTATITVVVATGTLTTLASELVLSIKE